MFAIIKKELWSFFGNWAAWIVIAAFSIVSALFLFFFENDSNILDIGTASLQSYFSLCSWLLMFIIPALTMRSFAEEQQNGTLHWLFSQPITTSTIVLGKYFAVFIVGFFCVIPSLIYFFTVYTLGVPIGNIDIGATMGSYLGLILLISAYTAIGTFASSVSTNQITAYLVGLFLCFLLFFGIEQLASFKLLGGADYILQKFGLYHHYLSFTRGLVDSRDVFYFLFVSSIFLLISNYSLQLKK